MRNYRWKKIFLNVQRTKWCIVRLYKTKQEMRQAYADYCIQYSRKDKDPFSVSGVSLHYSLLKPAGKGKMVTHGETGTVMLHVNSCGAGIVSHELAHAVLWAERHPKLEYPLVIKSMAHEEKILYNHTFAVRQFYKWYWKIVEKVNPNK